MKQTVEVLVLFFLQLYM